LALEAPEYAVAGALEPAYEVGGDTFDYAAQPEALTVSVTDAMGHGLQAALLAGLAVAALRNARRQPPGCWSRSITPIRRCTRSSVGSGL
jgi:serine phosphatase RsbU (regulator of sigma subunit)